MSDDIRIEFKYTAGNDKYEMSFKGNTKVINALTKYLTTHKIGDRPTDPSQTNYSFVFGGSNVINSDHKLYTTLLENKMKPKKKNQVIVVDVRDKTKGN